MTANSSPPKRAARSRLAERGGSRSCAVWRRAASPGGVAVGVVELLEVVDVEEQEREVPALAVLPRDRALRGCR